MGSNESDESNDIVVELGLTRRQTQSLQWILKCWLKQYEANEGSQLQEDVQGIYGALEGV